MKKIKKCQTKNVFLVVILGTLMMFLSLYLALAAGLIAKYQYILFPILTMLNPTFAVGLMMNIINLSLPQTLSEIMSFIYFISFYPYAYLVLKLSEKNN